MTALDCFLDPMCPWAYQTSLWLRDVRDRHGVAVRWRWFSLEEVNRPEGKRHPWERPWGYGWSPMRVGALLARRDPELVDRWLLAFGSALHERGEDVGSREACEALAAAAGLPDGVVEQALADPTTDEEVRADHRWLVEQEGGFGVPTLLVEGRRALFGPVVVPAPTGEDADRLWELVQLWFDVPFLYEVRTPKTPADLGHIATSFEPYLAGRRWQTIQKDAP